VALYWDFENLNAGLAAAKFGEGSYSKHDTRLKPQDPLIDILAIVELGYSLGPIAINRALKCTGRSGRNPPPGSLESGH
jgi:hypothetical protein